MTASGSPAASNELRSCSVVTSPVLWNATEVPPTNSMPKFTPRTPTSATTSTITTAAMDRNTLRYPSRLMSSLMKRPCTS